MISIVTQNNSEAITENDRIPSINELLMTLKPPTSPNEEVGRDSVLHGIVIEEKEKKADETIHENMNVLINN